MTLLNDIFGFFLGLQAAKEINSQWIFFLAEWFQEDMTFLRILLSTFILCRFRQRSLENEEESEFVFKDAQEFRPLLVAKKY